MALGLRLASRSQQSQLVLKALAFSVVLSLIRFMGGGFLISALFFLISAVLYFTPPFNSVNFFASFIVLSVTARIAIAGLSTGIFTLGLLFFGLVFYLLLAVKDLALLKRNWWHFILHLMLTYLVFLVFFYYYSQSPPFLSTVLFLGILFLSLERFKTPFILPAIIGLITVEVAWTIGFLPLGFINSAGVLTLASFFLGELIANTKKGTLSPKTTLTNLSVAVLILLIIFISTRWGI
jgi:hypothetical protein